LDFIGLKIDYNYFCVGAKTLGISNEAIYKIGKSSEKMRNVTSARYKIYNMLDNNML